MVLTMAANRNPGLGHFTQHVPSHVIGKTVIDLLAGHKHGKGHVMGAENRPSVLINRSIGIINRDANGSIRQTFALFQCRDNLRNAYHRITAIGQFFDMGIELINLDVG